MHSVCPRSLWLLIVACSLSGCHVFDDARSDASGPEKSKLPPITAAPNSIELEIGHIRRPVNDPLLGDALWSDVNQVVAGDDEASWQRIRNNGIRVGVAAARPPDSLVTLLQPDSANSNIAWTPARTTLQSVVVRDGTPTEVTASPFFAHCRIAFPESGETTYREYDLAQGKYEVTAKKTQDGWVELDFLPVIYHAEERTRRTATAGGTFTLQHGKKRKVFHTKRFKVRVMVGEWVVVGGNPDLPGTLGHQFYFGTEADDQQLQEYHRRAQQQAGGQTSADVNFQPAEEGQFQRLLVLRVANMKPAVVR